MESGWRGRLAEVGTVDCGKRWRVKDMETQRVHFTELVGRTKRVLAPETAEGESGTRHDTRLHIHTRNQCPRQNLIHF